MRLALAVPAQRGRRVVDDLARVALQHGVGALADLTGLLRDAVRRTRIRGVEPRVLALCMDSRSAPRDWKS